MNYLSHIDYKKFVDALQKKSPKGMLKESVEEGNAFTAALAKTGKGEKAKVGGKEITDTSNYDSSAVKEYSYTDNYPGSWGYREGLNPDPMQATGPTVNTVEENSISNPPMGFDALSPDEKKQLKEYIESVKTIKKEITKLAAKAGKKIKEGGDMTGLVMNPGAISENFSLDLHDRIESVIDQQHLQAFKSTSKMIADDLTQEGFSRNEIVEYLKYELAFYIDVLSER